MKETSEIEKKDQHHSIRAVERMWLLGLIYSIGILSALLLLFGQSVHYIPLLIAYAVSFMGLRLAAKLHKLRTDEQVPQPEAVKRWPRVCILLPAHDEASVIEKTVRSLSRLDYPDFELLVIDDRSTDGTGEILRRLEAEPQSNFRFYSRTANSRAGKAAVMNEALTRTDGEIIAVFDADSHVSPDFLTKLVPYFEQQEVGAVQSRKSVSNAERNVLTHCQKYEYALDAYFQSRRDLVHGAVELRGNGMLVRRKALNELGGFNERTVAEDLDLCTRMHMTGWDLRYSPEVRVWEEGMPAVRGLIRQRIRWTEGSLIRYLENGRDIIFDHNIAFRAKLDAMQFVFEFIAPVWLLFENTLLLLKWITGGLEGEPVLFASSAMLILSIYFLYATYLGATRYEGASFFESVRGTLMVYLYLMCLWLPIVFFLILRILWKKERNLNWDKTEHYGV